MEIMRAGTEELLASAANMRDGVEIPKPDEDVASGEECLLSIVISGMLVEIDRVVLEFIARKTGSSGVGVGECVLAGRNDNGVVMLNVSDVVIGRTALLVFVA